MAGAVRLHRAAPDCRSSHIPIGSNVLLLAPPQALSSPVSCAMNDIIISFVYASQTHGKDPCVINLCGPSAGEHFEGDPLE
eukprot:scaffold250787_cov45-Prasinocladus_malaysianus.AAC.1